MTPFDRRDFLRHAGGGMAALTLGPTLAGAAALDPVPRRERRLPQDAILRLGVVGTGDRGRDALEELATMERARVVAICDEDPGRIKGGRRRAPEAAAYGSVAELLEHDGLDAVVVCTPTHRHREVVEAVLAAGKHLYCEAPLAHDPADARAIAAACRDAEPVCAAGFTSRANPLYVRTRGVVPTAAVGRVVSADVHWHRKTSWRKAAPDPAWEARRNWRLDPALSLGLPGEAAAHYFDYLLWTTSGTPASVRGDGDVLLWNDGRVVADSVQLRVDLEGGGGWRGDLTLCNSYGGEQVHVHGVNGTVRAAETHAWLFKESDAPTQGWEVYATKVTHHEDEGLVLLANATKLAAQDKLESGAGLEHTPFWYALDDFVGASLAGEAPACSPEDALPATLLAMDAARAVSSGNPVQPDPSAWTLD